MSAAAPVRKSASGPALAAGNTIFVNVVALIAAVSAWPIYQSQWYLLAVAIALVAANLIAVLAHRGKWSAWRVTVTTVAVYLIGGATVASPLMWSDLSQVPNGLIGVVTAPVLGWKDILTLPLPLGAYRSTLVPTYLLFLVFPMVALVLVLRARWWGIGVLLIGVLPGFGILFGSSAVSQPMQLGPITISYPREIALGAATLIVLVMWMTWRARASRRLALRLMQTSAGPQSSSSRSHLGRTLSAIGMLVVAVLVALTLGPSALAHRARDVPRTWVNPTQQLQEELSPLASYREFMTNDNYGSELFKVDTSDSSFTRVRFATLSFFNGQVATVLNTVGGSSDASTAFLRVPQSVNTNSNNPLGTAQIDIANYTGLWVPTVGSLSSIAFSGQSRQALADGFFYNQNSQTAVTLPGLSSGDSYSLAAATESTAPALDTLQPSLQSSQFDPAVVPQSVSDWIKLQNAPAGGAGLELLIQRLRARGFLSHSLNIDAANPPDWTKSLGSYTFQASRAGHSTGRIDQLFTSLITKQGQVGGTNDAALVAAVGDDEQFAVAAAMIADQLGFPSRIALGTRLVDDGDTQAIPACQDGVCNGSNVTAWLEVQNSDGTWVPITVTPQHANPVARDVQQQQDPKNSTPVKNPQAQALPPAAAQPGQSDGTQSSQAQTGPNLAWLWGVLRDAGWVLLLVLVLFGPFLAIAAVKGARRRGRRTAPTAAERFVGGWDEYIDTAVDFGYPLPGNLTRLETAEDYLALNEQESQVVMLANWADFSVFAPDEPTEQASAEFWELVDRERLEFAASATRWQRIRAKISLRSFTRALHTAPKRKRRRWWPWGK